MQVLACDSGGLGSLGCLDAESRDVECPVGVLGL